MGQQNLARKDIARQTDEERKRLGVNNPLGDFAKDVGEHREALKNKTIDQSEYDRWLKKRRQQAVGEIDRDEPTSIHLNAAMASGSAEAHSIIAQASTSNPQMNAVQQTNAKLDQLIKALNDGNTQVVQTIKANGI